VTTLLALLTASTAWATSLAVAPAITDVQVEAGVSSEVTFHVANRADAPLAVQTSLADWWHDGTEHRTVVAGSTERSSSSWTEVFPATLVLPPRSQGELTAVLTPPPDATGGFYVVVLVSGSPHVDGSEQAAAGVGAGVAALLSVRIDGTGTEALALDRVEVSPPTASTPLVVTAFARNDGDVHLQVESRVVVLDEVGTVRATLASRSRVVLPGQALPIDAQWAGSLEAGQYDAIVTLAYGPGEVASAQHAFVVGDE